MDDENQSHARKLRLWSFRNVPGKTAELRFLIDGQIINVVQEYTYLGTRISSSGNFSLSRDISRKKLFMASLNSMKRHKNLNKLETSLACKLFDTVIFSILICNNEILIWGVYAKPDFKTRDSSLTSKRNTSSFANGKQQGV